jgi:hypothetical protein
MIAMSRRRRKRRRIKLAAVAAAVLVVLVLVGLYWALRHEPEFYRKAMAIKPAVLAEASDRMLKNIGTIQSAMTRSGRWHVVITAEEINGWLAVDLVKNYPNTLPPSVSDPRVAIDPNGMTMACRYQVGVNSVLSLTVQPYVPEPDVVALRIVRGRAGLLPVPLKKVLDGLSQGAANLRLRLRWVQAGSDPVAMLSLPEDEEADRVVRIESIELREGEIHVWGRTELKRRN